MKVDETLLGRDLFGEIIKPDIKGELKKRFLIPPFSVLSARDGDWQTRKRQWLQLGIKSEIGRGEAVTWGIAPSGQGTGKYSDKAYTDNAKDTLGRKEGLSWGDSFPNSNSESDTASVQNHPKTNDRGLAQSNGQDLMKGENPNFSQKSKMGNLPISSVFRRSKDAGDTQSQTGTSIFDPVLCELMYSWFCWDGGQILDPFCGGSVRGVVASIMGYKYWGCDLRQEQIDANYSQVSLCGDNKPEWITGDALDVLKDAPPSDFIFTCPPYGDLEVYSDNPKDISTMEFPNFIATLKEIIKLSCDKLKNNSFACIVVGDYRDKQGFYRCFPQHTVRAFLDCGLKLYNEIILVTSIGSLPIRITKQFESSRKIGKTHQNVLVFCKGKPPRLGVEE